MKKLVREKNKAIELRRKGYSYSEIMTEVPVAKSSLSLWLKDLPLTKKEKIVLKKRKNKNISRGRIKAASELHQRRLKREKVWLDEAKIIFDRYSHETLFHTGLALYWAEGAKRNNMCHFMNSDEKMIEIFLLWLQRYADYDREQVYYRLYLHRPYQHQNWESWWQHTLDVPMENFKKTIIKPTGLGIKKRPNYKGCLRIEVPKSTALLVKIKFWINMHVEYHKK